MVNKYTDETFMPFGKYYGRMLKNVPANYLIWYYGSVSFHGKDERLIQYIEENMDVLKKEIKR